MEHTFYLVYFSSGAIKVTRDPNEARFIKKMAVNWLATKKVIVKEGGDDLNDVLLR